MSDDMPGHAAEDQLAHARVTVRTHDQKVSIQIGETREDLVTHADIGCDRGAYVRLNTVPREGCGDRAVGAEGFFVGASDDLEDMHILCTFEQGKRIEDRARGLAPRLPGDHDVAADPWIATDIGNHQNGTTAFQREPLWKVKHG